MSTSLDAREAIKFVSKKGRRRATLTGRESTIRLQQPIIFPMHQTVEQVVREYRKASKMVFHENKTPEKARKFLLKAGILEKHSKSSNGVRVAKRYR